MDFTQPDAGLKVIRQIIDAAGTSKTLMVKVSKTEATVTVVAGTEVQAWGYRNGDITQVDTDVQYVDQSFFDINDFNLTDIGALFRTASSVSGSASQQTLQVVDYSGGDVLMSVSTNPESRTVFFRPDGSLVSTIDFHTSTGIAEGLKDAIGPKRQVYRVGIDSGLGAYIDMVGQDDTTVRRLRPAKFPASTSANNNAPNLPEFDPNTVSSDAIWSVLKSLQKQGDFDYKTKWSLIVEDREKTGTPLMYFDVGGESFKTNLKGERVS